MYKLCRTEKSVARQRELESGILEYMDTVPFFDIEIAELCRHLNIPRKTFYRYFGSMEDALYSLVDHRLADLNRFLQENHCGPGHTPWDSAVSYFTFWKGQKHFLDVLVRNYLTGVLMARAVMEVNLPPELIFTPVAQKDSPDNYMYNFWATGTLSIMLQWYFSGFQKSVQELADITQQLAHPSSPDKN